MSSAKGSKYCHPPNRVFLKEGKLSLGLIAMTWGEGELAPADEPFTLPFHELPTDVQDFTATDPDYMRMSDEEIEREIAEIKAALRKHSSTP